MLFWFNNLHIMAKTDIPVWQQVLTEQNQGHETRKKMFIDLEKELSGVPVVSFFTSFFYPVMIEDIDADMLEGLLQKMDLSRIRRFPVFDQRAGLKIAKF